MKSEKTPRSLSEAFGPGTELDTGHHGVVGPLILACCALALVGLTAALILGLLP